jgi:HK97 family phage major capsid protein
MPRWPPPEPTGDPMKKPTPQELEQLRATYPQGSPRFDYREMDLVVERKRVPAAADGDAEDIADGGADEAEENAPIPIAISSEAPVLRYDWWTDERYFEVLDHSAKSVDLSYAKDGLPFVMSHRAYDGDSQHGIVENVVVEKDRVLRGEVRMSRAQRSQEIAQDMRDGIRKKISVGYIVGEEYEQIAPKDKGGIPTRRYTAWMPVECSTVPVPADYAVGVGRAASPHAESALARFLELHPKRATPDEGARAAVPAPAIPAPAVETITAPAATQERTMPPETGTAPAGAPKTDTTANVDRTSGEVTAVLDRARADETERIENIRHLASAHSIPAEQVSAWIRDGATSAVVRGKINDILKARMADPTTSGGQGVELSPREQKRFNFARALILGDEGLRKEARTLDFGFEKEVLDELRKKGAETKNGGHLMPLTLDGFQSARAQEQMQRAGLDSATASLAGNFKITQPGDFITMLRNKTSVVRAGATFITGLTGPVTFPKQLTAATASWVGENPGSDQSESDLTSTTVSLAFKTIQANTRVSRQALFSAASGNYDLDQIIRADLAAIIGLAIDLGALAGTGASNQPTGILTASGVNAGTALGTAGGTMAWSNWIDLETKIGDANADTNRMAYITNTKQRGVAKNTAPLASTAASVPIWTNVPGEMDGMVNGYRAIASNQVPRNLTKGTSTTICSAVIFGAFEHCLIGQFGAGFEVLVDPYSKKNQNMIELTAWNFVDVALRYAEAFSKIVDAL